MRNFWLQNKYLIILFVLYAFAEILVNPWGDFPLNDDWSYAKSVNWLEEEGKIVLGNWPAMTLATHIVWGFVFAKIFGFSFLALRISTFVSALIGIYTLFQIGIKISNRKEIAFALSLSLLFNPIYFSLSNTYMTDVNFCTLLIMGIYLAIQFFEKPSIRILLLIFVVSVALVLLRQYGIILPIVFAFCSLFMKPRTWTYVLLSILLCVMTYLIYLRYEKYLQGALGPQAAYKFSNSLSLTDEKFWETFLYGIETRYKIILIHFLFYPFVFVFGFLPSIVKSVKWQWQLILYLFIFAFTYWLFIDQPLQVGNIFSNVALGTDTSYQTLSGKFSGQVHFYSQTFQIVLNVIKSAFISISAYLLIVSLVIMYRNRGEKWKPSMRSIFLIILFFSYLPMILITETFFDRYQLPVILLGLILFSAAFKTYSFSFRWFLIPCVFWMSISIAGTHDYFSWNSLKWQAYSTLEKETANAEDRIQPGFEIMCWSKGPEVYLQDFSDLHKFNYLIQFDPIDSFVTYKNYPYQRWLLPGSDTLRVLKRYLYPAANGKLDTPNNNPKNQ